MAVKIHRDPKKIALIGIPSSAGSHGPGAERAPAALRAAGLQSRLEAAGFEVFDHGDTPVFPYRPDEEHPRARNTAAVVEAMSALRAKVEIAAKSGALLLILGGDCAITPGTVAGLRRYYREVGVFWMDRDADLNTPTTTPSGCVHGMTVAHLTGRGAAEIVRFSADMPMVREPNLALFGLERLDPPEEQLLLSVPLRAYHAADILRRGPAAAAREAIERIHSPQIPFLLHYDVDVISSPDFTACGFPAEGSLLASHVRDALEEVTAVPQLLAIELCEYFPERDADGAAARFLVELFAEALAGRLRALAQPPAPAEAEPAAPSPAVASSGAAEPAPAQPAAESAPAASVSPDSAPATAESAASSGSPLESAPSVAAVEAASPTAESAPPAAHASAEGPSPPQPADSEAVSAPAGDSTATSAGK